MMNFFRNWLNKRAANKARKRETYHVTAIYRPLVEKSIQWGLSRPKWDGISDLVVDAAADIAASMSQLEKIVDVQTISAPTSIAYLARPYDTKGLDLTMVSRPVSVDRQLLVSFDVNRLTTKGAQKLFGDLLVQAGINAAIRRTVSELIKGHQMTSIIPPELDPSTIRMAIEKTVQRMDGNFTEANVMFVTSHDALLRVAEAMVDTYLPVPTAKRKPSPITHVGNIGDIKVYLVDGMSDLLQGQVMVTTIGRVKLIGDASVVYTPFSTITPVQEGDEIAFYIEHSATYHPLDDNSYANIIQVM